MFFDKLIPLAWVVLALAIIGVLFVTWSDIKGAPFVTTPRKTIHKMLEMAQVGPDDVVFDLGSGDGRVLFIAAGDFGARAVGIEIDPFRWLWTQGWVSLRKLRGRVSVIRGDVFQQDLSQADVVVCFLLQSTNEKLLVKLEAELSPGTRVISRKFTFPGWQLLSEDRDEKLYLYRIRDRSIA